MFNLDAQQKSKLIKQWSEIKVFFRRFTGWLKILEILTAGTINIISNPSFIMFSIIAIGLGTMGIWLPFSPFYASQAGNTVSSVLDNLAVFTFCIATLGNMATEYFFEEKGKEGSINDEIANDHEYKGVLSRHAAFFGWSLAFLLSMFSLASDKYVLLSIVSTLLLWLFVNINRPKFRAINNAALKDLEIDLKADGSGNKDDEFGGPGL